MVTVVNIVFVIIQIIWQTLNLNQNTRPSVQKVRNCINAKQIKVTLDSLIIIMLLSYKINLQSLAKFQLPSICQILIKQAEHIVKCIRSVINKYMTIRVPTQITADTQTWREVYTRVVFYICICKTNNERWIFCFW